MSGTSITKVNTETGEVTTVEPFDQRKYLQSLDTGAQQALAAAYDKACADLIGPNDVQQEGGRTFKKKSAWRKLARHFGISTSVQSITKDYLGADKPVFLATVTVQATGPWGQSSDAVGACATDEATGRRIITIADAIATAETRATNRAVSNLIAMGEVSAEEMSKGERSPAPARGTTPVAASSYPTRSAGSSAEFVMPFGRTKGTPLGKLSAQDIAGAVEWARSKGKFAEFCEAADAVLEARSAPAQAPQGGFEEMPAGVGESDDSEPF